MKNLTSLIIMTLFELIIIGMFILIRKKGSSKNQIKAYFSCMIICMFIWTLSLIFQILFQNTNIPPITFEGFAAFGACFIGVFILLLGITFSKTKLEFKKSYLFLFIIPCITTFLTITNDLHHLMYVKYSTELSETIYGPYMSVHSIYTYLTVLIGLAYMLIYNIKNSGFFSKQSILIILGVLAPIVINALGYMNIVHINVYTTPIYFTVAILFFALAIFKFDFLTVAPIALQKVVDRISDCFLILDEDYNVIDFNQTFLDTFKLKDLQIRGKSFYKLMGNNLDKQFEECFKKIKNSNKTYSFELKFHDIKKIFAIEINNILSKKTNLGILVLFKDITQHVEDIKNIENKQDQLIEQERLASLGQMIGGIAHNLKTPIMSIAGASEGINDLIKELDASIGNPVVKEEDFHDIAKDMFEWNNKIKSYTEYMSDIITAVKGQATELSNDTKFSFTISEVFKRVQILMKHELKNAVVYLNPFIKADENTTLSGDVNSLVQVINNMISNSIQAYNGKPEQQIDFTAFIEENNIIFQIKDYGPGLPEKVKSKLFKEMVTTKGKHGTGLGLYMSYSNIKAHFNGTITYESVEGKGTTFNIILPLN